MYRVLAVLAVCSLALGVAIGQSSTDQRQSQSSGTQQQQPSSQSQSQSAQPQQDRNATGSASGSASGSVPTRPSDQSANPNSDQPARASTRTGIPLSWLIVGGIILVLVVIALASRGSSTVVDRSERVEHHDDIRRAS